ncbi:hypothetical protein MXD81_27550, partial [Microbacteriaceae bacterium K1510]|nr:hypothetical protein [Microbacteriaceae bacterium K1510]
IYVDPTTGLPVRSIYARANMLDKPIFEATYTYPADIKIDTPQFPGAAPEKPAEKKYPRGVVRIDVWTVCIGSAPMHT